MLFVVQVVAAAPQPPIVRYGRDEATLAEAQTGRWFTSRDNPRNTHLPPTSGIGYKYVATRSQPPIGLPGSERYYASLAYNLAELARSSTETRLAAYDAVMASSTALRQPTYEALRAQLRASQQREAAWEAQHPGSSAAADSSRRDSAPRRHGRALRSTKRSDAASAEPAGG